MHPFYKTSANALVEHGHKLSFLRRGRNGHSILLVSGASTYPSRGLRAPKIERPALDGEIGSRPCGGRNLHGPIGNSVQRENSFEREKVKAQSRQWFVISEGMQHSTRRLVTIHGLTSEATPIAAHTRRANNHCSHRFQAARRS
jgi:hypothetical protein